MYNLQSCLEKKQHLLSYTFVGLSFTYICVGLQIYKSIIAKILIIHIISSLKSSTTHNYRMNYFALPFDLHGLKDCHESWLVDGIFIEACI